jgi:HEAT repeat protein
MDDVQQLIDTFSAGSTTSVRSKLAVLTALERLSDPRVVPFLLQVLEDRSEPENVRIHVLKRLRNGTLSTRTRPAVAEAIMRLLDDRVSPDLRAHAALALAEFTEIDAVPARLGCLALDVGEPIELRFSAFTSLQKCGPTTQSVALFRRMLTDEALGRSARSVLASWRVE